MMFSAKVIAYAAIIHTVWHAIRPFHGASAWPMKVRAGPAKGALLVLDLRENGAYWLGTYDNWILSLSKICFLGAGLRGIAARTLSTIRLFFVARLETSTSNHQRLRQLPGLNHWPNLHVIHSAVGPDHTALEFASELAGVSGPIGLVKEYDLPMRSERAACAGVDELCFERDVPLPDFIKFDLEGAEVFALLRPSTDQALYRWTILRKCLRQHVEHVGLHSVRGF